VGTQIETESNHPRAEDLAGGLARREKRDAINNTANKFAR